MPGAELPSLSSDSVSSARPDLESSVPAPSANGAILAALVQELSIRERLVVCLRYCDGLSVAEVAAVLGEATAEVDRLLGSIAERAKATIASLAGAS